MGSQSAGGRFESSRPIPQPLRRCWVPARAKALIPTTANGSTAVSRRCCSRTLETCRAAGCTTRVAPRHGWRLAAPLCLGLPFAAVIASQTGGGLGSDAAVAARRAGDRPARAAPGFLAQLLAANQAGRPDGRGCRAASRGGTVCMDRPRVARLHPADRRTCLPPLWLADTDTARSRGRHHAVLRLWWAPADRSSQACGFAAKRAAATPFAAAARTAALRASRLGSVSTRSRPLGGTRFVPLLCLAPWASLGWSPRVLPTCPGMPAKREPHRRHGPNRGTGRRGGSRTDGT